MMKLQQGGGDKSEVFDFRSCLKNLIKKMFEVIYPEEPTYILAN